jgi:tetratricopeptide (TPR) repeat protein
MDSRTYRSWVRLSQTVLRARCTSNCCDLNPELEAAAAREPQSPVAGAYTLWLADNLAREGQYLSAANSYDAAVERSQAVKEIARGTFDTTPGALYHKAQALTLSGNVDSAITAYTDLKPYPARARDAFLQAGQLAERSGDLQRAADLYSVFAAREDSARTDDATQLARRALQRLGDTVSPYYSTPYGLMEAISEALESADGTRLSRLVSRTHFSIGAVGGHTAFEDLGMLDRLARDLSRSAIAARKTLQGSNSKRYLLTSGWNGMAFQGDVIFLLTEAPRGWQWTGLGISAPNDFWANRWRPQRKETNSPLPFELLAPWPKGQCFMAGGFMEYLILQKKLLDAGSFMPLVAFALSADDCGFGPRGYYYNFDTTHTEAEAFAIDFTRYRQYLPYDNVSGGTPVLAARDGEVSLVNPGVNSGDSSAPNVVEIEHADPNNPTDKKRFTSRYLHLEGPFKILVSEHMPVFAGNRLGLMDDTGNSILDHLHFCIHDRQIPHPKSPLGASVRPTPMSGYQLEDSDSATCICSTNREVLPMKILTDFAVQNWLITPSATAVNEQIDNIRDQRFLLILSGVAMVNFKGDSGADWLNETVLLLPPVVDAVKYAIDRWQVPTPEDTNYTFEFETEQWAPIVTLSSVWNQDESVNSGFAVDAWRMNPWTTGSDAGTNETLNQLFSGLQVDIAVRDSDAWIFRLGYQISLLGRIAYRSFGAIS